MSIAFTLSFITWFDVQNAESRFLWAKLLKTVKVLIEAKCHGKGWQILELAIQPDHVHLFVRAWPTVSAAEVVKECKGITLHELRRRYPQKAF